MRKTVLIVLLLLHSILTLAQENLPAFGKIDKSDLLLKDCEFDKGAEAYKLIDYCNVHYVFEYRYTNIEKERRIRIKILNEKGLNFANIKLRFYSKSDYEEIKNISAVTYNLDNSGNTVISTLEKSSIYTKKINDHLSEIAFSMPDVKPGSVIEYQYTDIRTSVRDLHDWYFQDVIPTRISILKTHIPSFFDFSTQVMTNQKVEEANDTIIEKQRYGNPVTSFGKTYILKNIPAFREEPFMGAEEDYLQKIIFQSTRIYTWEKLTAYLLDDESFGLQLRKNIPHTNSLDDSLKDVKDEYNKMVVIYNYVRKNMNWNGIENIYSRDGIKSAWDKKSGSNADLNLILINLLRDANLKAYPLLVSTKDHGAVNTSFPFLEQFNNTMICVLVSNKTYILNAADKYNPANLIPYDVLNSEGFIVDEKKGGWVRLSDDEHIWKNVVSIFAEITPDALMKGEATISSYGYSKNPRVETWKENKSSFNDYFKNYAGIKIDSVEIKNEDVDNLPLEQKLNFSLPISSSGEYEYFTLNLFQDLEKNPFIADERRSDIQFNYKQSYTIVSNITIPDNYEFDELPKNIIMRMPDSSIVLKRALQAENGSIEVRITLDFFEPSYPASAYPLLQQFYKKLFTTLNEQVVIKKKKEGSR